MPLTPFEIADDVLRKRQRRGQPRGFNAEQIDQPGHAVRRFGGDHKVGRLFTRTGQLRPDAAIVRHQRSIGQARPIGSNALIKGIRTARIDGVALVIDPLDVRAEAHAAGKVERDMHAEPAIDRRRIDQPREDRPSGEGEIVAFGKHERRHFLGRVILDLPRQRLRAEPGGIHHRIEFHGAGVAAAELHFPVRRRVGHALDRRFERDAAAAIFQFAPQRQHVAVTVDDAGFRRRQCADAGKLRLERARGVTADHLQPFDAVGQSLRQERLDLGELGLVGRDDQLAAFVGGDAVRGAEFVQHAPPAHAMARAQRCGRIIDAGVNDLAVARRHAVADAAGRLGDDHVVPAQRRRARDRKPDNARADDQYLHARKPCCVYSTGQP